MKNETEIDRYEPNWYLDKILEGLAGKIKGKYTIKENPITGRVKVHRVHNGLGLRLIDLYYTYSSLYFCFESSRLIEYKRRLNAILKYMKVPYKAHDLIIEIPTYKPKGIINGK